MTIPPEAEGQRLDRALALYVSGGLRARRRLCEEGHVLLNGRAVSAGVRVRAGQCLAIALAEEAETASPARSDKVSGAADDGPRLIARSANLAALYKPAGLPTVRLAGSLRPAVEDWLPRLLGPADSMAFVPCLLNRLDTGTSGLVVAALTCEGASLWRQAEDRGDVCTRYLAIAEGDRRAGDRCRCTAALDTARRKKSRILTEQAPPIRWTSVTVLAQLPPLGATPRLLLGCQIARGARHQIRAHLASLGMPLVGDRLYGARDTLPFCLHHTRLTCAELEAACLPIWFDALPSTAREATAAWLALPPDGGGRNLDIIPGERRTPLC